MGRGAVISDGSKFVVFRKGKDSLGLFSVQLRAVSWTAGVKSFRVLRKADQQFLVYQELSTGKLLVQDLEGKRKFTYSGVSSFYTNQAGNILLIECPGKADSGSYSLKWVDLLQETAQVIFNGNGPHGDIVSDEQGKQLLFACYDGKSPKCNSIWYYAAGKDSAVCKIDSSGLNAYNCAVGQEDYRFTGSGDRVLFHGLDLNEAGRVSPDNIDKSINVWSYKDKFIQPSYWTRAVRREYLFSMGLSGSSKAVRLEMNSDKWELSTESSDGKYIAFITIRTDPGEEYWRKGDLPDLVLVSTADGSRKIIRRSILTTYDVQFSPESKYLIWYDRLQNALLSYDLVAGEVRNITQRIPVPYYDTEDDHPSGSLYRSLATCVEGWLPGDEALIVHDLYDIWRVSPGGDKDPVNLSGSYGRKNRIMLRYFREQVGNESPVFRDSSGSILLTGFNKETKENGFYRVSLTRPSSLHLLASGPYIYYVPQLTMNAYVSFGDFPPCKAEKASVFLLRRMSASEYSNLYTTSDFKNFRQVTFLAPQQHYNWYTTELHHWRMKDGNTGKGMLFKPQDFDERKKYPVIFYFYERMSDGLNAFRNPEFCDGKIDIPYFVSNGYLVFVPDIEYRVGFTGASVENSVIPAAAYLSSFAWADKSRMGVQGHSFGAYQVAHLITRTDLFHAACVASGPYDLVSWYGSYRNEGGFGLSNQLFLENDQFRIGQDIWSRPDLYISNSPIFHLDKIHTPLLILHNPDDVQAWMTQGLELFLGLRRLGKKAWLLQYDGEAHGVLRENAKDYTIRIKQFFDHYLKGAKPPKWMTSGVPAFNKKFDSGLELDLSSIAP